MIQSLDLETAELSVHLTDDAMIHDLNRRYRQQNRPTDVLAFPLADARWLGDVVISLDTAARQARTRRRTLLAEVTLLLAHGLLHLVGHDHHTVAEKRRMDAASRDLLRAAIPSRKRSGVLR
jgi:probable rRNA maturation factor